MCISLHAGTAPEDSRDVSRIGRSCLCLISKELEGDWVWHFEGKQLEVKSCPVKLEVDAKILQINTPS